MSRRRRAAVSGAVVLSPYAGAGAFQAPTRPPPRVVIEAVDDGTAKEAWTAVYDLLFLGRVRSPEEIDGDYIDPPEL